MTTQEIRSLFLSFFRDRGHLVRPSAPLVLHDDPTSLFTSAGMQPYMAAYRGEEAPPGPRWCSIQKCCRTVDIDSVGIHNRYATFFEMLGNFALGDYFKEGAIDLAWELFHDVLQLDTERLWFTVYTDDDEAADIWHKRIGIPSERILRFGRSDNWWPKVRWEGPCGPCSEIHIDLGEELSCGKPDCRVNCDCDRYLELWNLVFQQFTEAEDGTKTPLPRPGIDTGMGLERLSLVLQGKRYVTETDEMWGICSGVVEAVNRQRATPLAYGDDRRTDLALRIITDHLRAAAFVLCDGVVPGNEGAGYVLRRFVRRAYRFGRQLGATQPFLYEALPGVARAMGHAYPELSAKEAFATSILRREEDRFASTLEQGMAVFEDIVDGLDGKVIPGDKAFRLYDTYGFPLEVTVEMAAERGLSVDEEGFRAAMEQQRVRSRGAEVGLQGARDVQLGAKLPPTEFVGYEALEAHGQVLALVRDGELVDVLKEGESGGIVLDRTAFYAERGGQAGDTGTIYLSEGEFAVTDTVAVGDSTLHLGKVLRGRAIAGPATGQVDGARRRAIQANHTATHLLHEALRRILGEHVDQAGSLVAPDRLRFDFTHHESVDRQVLAEVEDLVNTWIVANLPVSWEEQEFEAAKRAGARALFTEKYGDVVRTVHVGGVSLELCGGTHCHTTGEIGSLRIVHEGSVAAGMRRIEAVTGLEAVRRGRQMEDELRRLAQDLNCTLEEVPQRVEHLQARIGELQRELKQARQTRPAANIAEIVAQASEVGGLRVVARLLPDTAPEALMDLVDEVATKLGEGVVLLASTDGDKVALVCKASDGAVAAGAHAGNLVRDVATRCGGGGGGKANFARAGGKDPSKAVEALAAVPALLADQLQRGGGG